MQEREVVAALICEQGRILVCQRPANKARGLLWEFVGGKVEQGETHAGALIRECLEELDITVQPGSLFFETVHTYPDIQIHLFLYHASIVSGKITCLEHADAKWALPHELPSFAFCPADNIIIDKIIKGVCNMQRVYDFLKKTGTYYLATVDSGEPRVRPFGTIDQFEDGLYIQTGKVKPTYRQLSACPAFELCAFDGNTWLRLTGRAVEDDRREAREHMLDAYPSLKAMYSADDGNTVVFRLTNCTAVFSSFTKEPETIQFM